MNVYDVFVVNVNIYDDSLGQEEKSGSSASEIDSTGSASSLVVGDRGEIGSISDMPSEVKHASSGSDSAVFRE